MNDVPVSNSINNITREINVTESDYTLNSELVSSTYVDTIVLINDNNNYANRTVNEINTDIKNFLPVFDESEIEVVNNEIEIVNDSLPEIGDGNLICNNGLNTVSVEFETANIVHNEISYSDEDKFCIDVVYCLSTEVADTNVDGTEINDVNYAVSNTDEFEANDKINVNNAVYGDVNNDACFSDLDLNICALNVCGLKSKLLTPEFENFVNKYDILCFSETKLTDLDDTCIPGYECYCKNRSNNKSGGIAIFIRKNINNHFTIIKSKCDFIMFIKGHNVCQNGDIIIGAVYLPPIDSIYSNVDSFDEIEDEIVRVSSLCNNICLLGDFNSRTGQLLDYIEPDKYISEVIDVDSEADKLLFGCEILKNIGVPLNRANSDRKSPNTFGYRLIDLCKNSNLFIVNGRVGNDKGIGKTTSKGVSLIDYAVCSPMLFNIIDDFSVLNFCGLLSDIHCPIVIKFKLNINHVKLEEIYNPEIKLRKWIPEKANLFVDNIDREEIRKIHDLLNNYEDVNIKCVIGGVTKSISNIFSISAKKSFGYFKKKK